MTLLTLNQQTTVRNRLHRAIRSGHPFYRACRSHRKLNEIVADHANRKILQKKVFEMREIALKFNLFHLKLVISAKGWKMKRGRGRPRKNSMTSDLSNTQNSYLEEGKPTPLYLLSKNKNNCIDNNSITDLQFSTDDGEFEEVVGENESIAATLGQGEALARSSQPVNYAPGKDYPGTHLGVYCT